MSSSDLTLAEMGSSSQLAEQGEEELNQPTPPESAENAIEVAAGSAATPDAESSTSHSSASLRTQSTPSALSLALTLIPNPSLATGGLPRQRGRRVAAHILALQQLKRVDFR